MLSLSKMPQPDLGLNLRCLLQGPLELVIRRVNKSMQHLFSVCSSVGIVYRTPLTCYIASGVGSQVRSCRLVDLESSEDAASAQKMVAFLVELRLRRSVRV